MAGEGYDVTAGRTDRRGFIRSAAATAGIGVIPGSTAARRVIETSDRRRATMPATPRLAANLNGRPRRILDDLDRLDESNTTWVRAFIDVRRKLRDGGDPARDPDVVALRRAAREHGCRLVVNLKWDFRVNWAWDDKEPARVPAPGSEREEALLRGAERYLRAIGEPVDVVVLGNEPMWETKRADVVGDEPAVVRFTRNVKDHLVRHGGHGSPRYLVGAFNRLYVDGVLEDRFDPFCRGLFRLARRDDDVDGVDLHIHYRHLGQARRMLEVTRERLPHGILAVTEFSPVHRYDRHVRTQIGTWPAGRAFAEAYGYSPELTAVDYFERAKADRRPADEMADFYEAMPWYRVDHLRRNYRLFAEYGVSVGAFGFLQGPGMRRDDWRRPGWTPFHINFLYQDALVRGRGPNLHYVGDYRELAGPSPSLPGFADDLYRSLLDGDGRGWGAPAPSRAAGGSGEE